MVGLSGAAMDSSRVMGEEGMMHPLDQFQNNQDLLNYLNQTPQVQMTANKFGDTSSIHRRGHSQQSINMSKYGNNTQ